jgi:hypothetical protein
VRLLTKPRGRGITDVPRKCGYPVRRLRLLLTSALCLGFVCVPLAVGPVTVASAAKQCVAGWLDEGPFLAAAESPAYEYDAYDTYSDWVRVDTNGGENWRYQDTDCSIGPLFLQYDYQDRLEVCNEAGHFGCSWNGGWGNHLGLTTNGPAAEGGAKTQRLKPSQTPFCFYDDVYDSYFAKATLGLKYSSGL